MADKLMFPVGFDLEGAVKAAEAEWSSKYQAKLSKAIESKPLSVNVTFDAKQLGNLEDVKKRLSEIKLAPVTPETKNAISSLVSELKNLEKILEHIDRLNEKIGRRQSTASPSQQAAAQRSARLAEIQARTAARQQQDAAKLAILEERRKQAVIRTAEAERRRAEAVSRVNKAYKSQEGYIDRLIKRTAVLFSIGTALNFARSIREVTAEFELQRVALGSIIKDTQKATELFNQIKAFAVKSPFEIKDLVSYTKQLSAYQIETDQLFDTMKRLADVSAGLGVSMDRIILAYGQVKAASVLRGSELRQFTEAGIPLVQMLADKFTQLRGELVSTGEVFDLISKRAVSFEMVKEVFEDMTNAGGIFYNMQEKQSETLAGQWANLKDAYSIMLDEIGRTEAVGSAMESLISGTKNLADHWQGVSSFISQVTAATILYAKTVDKTVMSVKKQIWAEKELEAQRIRAMAIGRALTDSEKRRLAITRNLTAADYKRIITEGKISSLQLVRMARESASNKQLERGILLSGKMSKEQIQSIQSASRLNYTLGVMKTRFQNMGGALVNAGRSIGMFIKSMAPILLLTEVISLFAEWRRSQDELAAALEKNEKEYDDYANTLQRIENAYKEAEIAAKKAAEADEGFAKAIYGDKLKQLQEIAKLLDNLGLKNIIDFSVLDESSIDKVAEAWIAKLKEINKATRVWGQEVADVATAYQGNLMGWSIFGENLAEDMKDLRREWNKLTTDKTFAGELERMRLYVGKMANESKEFYENMSRTVGEDAKLALSAKRRNESDVQYWDRILKNYKTISYLASTGNLLEGTYNAFKDIPVDFKDEMDEVMHEFDKTLDALKGKDPMTIKAAIDRIFLQHEWDDTLKELFIKEANKKHNLKIPVSYEFEPQGEADSGIKAIIQSEFPSLFDEEELKKMSSAQQVVSAIEKRLKEAKENMEAVSKLQNNATGDAKKYEATINNINKQLEEERAKSVVDRDDKKIANLEAELEAMKQSNKAYDEHIKKAKESAEEEYKRAKAAFDRVAAIPLSSIAKDVETAFAGLLSDSISEATDKDYPVKLKITDKELEGISDIGELYDLWVKRMEDVEKEEKKVADLHVSDVQIEKERAELAARQAEAKEQLAAIEKEIQGQGYQSAYEEYKRLKFNLAMATTQEARLKAEKELEEFRNKERKAEESILFFRMYGLETLIQQKQVAGEIANEQIGQYKKQLEEAKNFLAEMAKRYNFVMPPDKKKAGGGEDPWIMLMKNRMKFMQDFQKGVEDLSKFLQKTKALGQEQDIMLFRGKSLDIDVSALEGTQEELLAWFDDAIAQVSKKIAKLGGKTWEGLGVKAILSKDTKSRMIKAYQDLLQELFNQKTDFQTNKLKEQLEAELKRLADEVSRTKEAKEFFDKIISLTGDRKLSATITADIYGDTGEGLKQKIIDQIEGLFKAADGAQIDLSEAINYKTLEINYLKLAQIAEKNSDKIAEKSKEAIDGITEAGIKATAERVANWEKEIQKEQSFSEKRLRLAKETAEKIAEIEMQEGMERSEKDRLQQEYRNAEMKKAAELEYEAFKNTPLYTEMFDDLESASKSALEAMIMKLQKLKEQWGQSLSPTDLKEMQGRMNEIEAQLVARNPFKALGEAIKGYMRLSKKMSKKEADKKLAQDMEAEKVQAEQYAQALMDAQKAEEAYSKAAAEHGTGSEEAKNAREEADQKWKAAKSMKTMLDIARSHVKATSDIIAGYEELNEKTKAAIDAFQMYTEYIDRALDTVQELMETFGADDAAMQFFEDMKNGFEEVAKGTAQLAAGAAQMETNPVAGAGNIFSGIGGLIPGFGKLFTAGKVRRANREIERQQKIIDALSHSYDRLQKASDSLFGGEFLQNYKDQTKNLQAQIVATQKQLEAEKSKGSRKDKEKMKQYEEQIQDLQDQLEDMKGTVSEQFLGSDLAGAARTFADAWIDAYKEFGDTKKAIEKSMEDMMDNLIREAVLGEVMKVALKPVFDMIEDMGENDFSDPRFWQRLVGVMGKAIENAETGAENVADFMARFGVLSRDIGSEFTGISKDIATASEESILGLAAGINTQNFYISHIDSSVAQILAIMQGGGAGFASSEQMTDLVTVQNQHLSYLPTIAQNTSEIVARAERAATACESIASSIDRVVKPRGVKGGFVVNTAM